MVLVNCFVGLAKVGQAVIYLARHTVMLKYYSETVHNTDLINIYFVYLKPPGAGLDETKQEHRPTNLISVTTTTKQKCCVLHPITTGIIQSTERDCSD